MRRVPGDPQAWGERLVSALPAAAEARLRRLYTSARHALSRPASGPADNVAANRRMWDGYALRWDDPEFRSVALDREGRDTEDPNRLAVLGDEWGRPGDIDAIIDAWITPHVTAESVVGEIGIGGARLATRVAPHVGEFHGFDVSSRMLQRAAKQLAHLPHVELHLLDAPRLPESFAGRFDLVYSFDVFVHLDLHVQWSYFSEFARTLRPGGHAFVHTANLTTDAGWARFSAQDSYNFAGFYFMTPEAVRTLARRAGLEVVKERGGEPGTYYDERDYLVLLRRP